ncbi:MAG TPA: hypothetical protein VH677_04160 [Nitrososphaera sp.]
MTLGARGNGTEAITFRLSKDLVDLLRKDAAFEKISTSALMNKVMASYFEFYKLVDSTSMIAIPKKTLKTMLDDMPRERVLKLASITETELTNLFYLNKNHHDTDSILQEFLAWMGRSGASSREIFEDGERVIIINHGMGDAMSFLISMVLMRWADKADDKLSIASENGLLIIRIKQKEKVTAHMPTLL